MRKWNVHSSQKRPLPFVKVLTGQRELAADPSQYGIKELSPGNVRTVEREASSYDTSP